MVQIFLDLQNLSVMFLHMICVQQICMKLFFKESSAAEIGTACSSMNRTGRSNAKKGPEKCYNAYQDFSDCETEAYIIARWMKFVGMTSMEGDFN